MDKFPFFAPWYERNKHCFSNYEVAWDYFVKLYSTKTDLYDENGRMKDVDGYVESVLNKHLKMELD